MTNGSVTFERWPYEEAIWHVQVSASDKGASTCQDFYAHIADLEVFAAGLRAFPRQQGDVVELKYGAHDPKVAYFVHLKASLLDPAGHAGLLISTDSNSPDPHRRVAHFTIRSEVASLNSLGEKLTEWIQGSEAVCHAELSRG
jgi:hypothetical protein